MTTARANQRTGVTNGREANWAPEVAFSPFRALSRRQLTFPFLLPMIKEKASLPVNVRRSKRLCFSSLLFFLYFLFVDGHERKRLVSSHLGRTSSIVACSRLSDSGETQSERHTKSWQCDWQGGKKEKENGRPFSPHFPPGVFFFSRSRFLIIERTRLSRSQEEARPIKVLLSREQSDQERLVLQPCHG